MFSYLQRVMATASELVAQTIRVSLQDICRDERSRFKPCPDHQLFISIVSVGELLVLLLLQYLLVLHRGD